MQFSRLPSAIPCARLTEPPHVEWPANGGNEIVIRGKADAGNALVASCHLQPPSNPASECPILQEQSCNEVRFPAALPANEYAELQQSRIAHHHGSHELLQHSRRPDDVIDDSKLKTVSPLNSPV